MPIAAQPLLEEVSRTLDESSSVAVLEEGSVVFVARSATRRIMSVTLRVGSRVPTYCTALGRVLLAHLEPEQLTEQLATHGFPRAHQAHGALAQEAGRHPQHRASSGLRAQRSGAGDRPALHRGARAQRRGRSRRGDERRRAGIARVAARHGGYLPAQSCAPPPTGSAGSFRPRNNAPPSETPLCWIAPSTVRAPCWPRSAARAGQSYRHFTVRGVSMFDPMPYATYSFVMSITPGPEQRDADGLRRQFRLPPHGAAPVRHLGRLRHAADRGRAPGSARCSTAGRCCRRCCSGPARPISLYLGWKLLGSGEMREGHARAADRLLAGGGRSSS